MCVSEIRMGIEVWAVGKGSSRTYARKPSHGTWIEVFWTWDIFQNSSETYTKLPRLPEYRYLKPEHQCKFGGAKRELGGSILDISTSVVFGNVCSMGCTGV